MDNNHFSETKKHLARLYPVACPTLGTLLLGSAVTDITPL